MGMKRPRAVFLQTSKGAGRAGCCWSGPREAPESWGCPAEDAALWAQQGGLFHSTVKSLEVCSCSSRSAVTGA